MTSLAPKTQIKQPPPPTKQKSTTASMSGKGKEKERAVDTPKRTLVLSLHGGEPNGVTRMAKDTALATMDLGTTVQVPDVAGHTNAPSVDPLSTTLRRFTVLEVFPIVMPFHHWVWKDMLEDAGVLDKYTDIPAGIAYGFHIGLENFTLT
ncbi:hypothetical protein F5146DRAFT_1146068 [Armillaria mellea]|nr:hypothetical protein F5146DRAFT_1146068 [Armillaria mellea]